MLYLSQNIKKLRSDKGLSQAKLAKLLGIVPGTISNYENGVSEPNLEVIEKLTKILDVSAHDLLYTNLSTESLQTKSTESVNNANVNSDVNPNVNFPKLHERLTNTPSKKIIRDLAESLSDKLKGSTGGYVEVPLVDIEAAAGGGAPNADFIEEAENIRFPLSLLHHATGKLLCINVVGESMEPTLFDGSLVVIRLIDRSQWGSIRSGDVYVITDREGATYIKRVRNKLRSQGVLIMTSDNPDQRRYKPFERAEDEILNVWAVELVISNNIPPSDREIDDLRDRIDDLQALIERLVDREN